MIEFLIYMGGAWLAAENPDGGYFHAVFWPWQLGKKLYEWSVSDD